MISHASEAGEIPLIKSDEAADAAADEVDIVNVRVRDLLRAASDAAVREAYGKTEGEVSDLKVETLREEMRHRGTGT